MLDGLGPGAHVRHRRRPEWGIGLVASLVRSDGHVDIVVDFEHAGEKKVRAVEDTFEQVPADEIEAWQEARRKAQVDQKKAERRVARAKSLKTTTLSPAATVACGWGSVEATRGGSVVVALGGVLRFFDASGALLDEVATGWPPSDELTVHGDFIVGRRTHDWGNLLLYRQGERRAQVWRSPIEPSIRRVAAAGEDEVVLWDSATLLLVAADGASRQVPFEVAAGAHICGVRAWGDALLVGTAGPEAPEQPYFHIVCVGPDGSVRWRREGREPTPFSASLLMVIDGGVAAVAPDGALVSRVTGARPSGGIGMLDAAAPFVALDDDVVFCSERSVMRCRPSDGTVVWSTEVPASSSLEPPVLAGPVVAATTSVYGEGKTVWLLDAASGRMIAADNATTKVSSLCAVGPDALVTSSFSKKLIGWRKLSSSPERFSLTHPDKVFDLCSPAPGALVARTGDHLTFWRL